MLLECLKPTLQSVNHVLSEKMRLKVETGSPAFKYTDEPLGDITSMTSLMSKELHISMALSFNETTAFFICSNFTNKEHHKVDSIVVDIVKMITTMVANEARKRLEKFGYKSTIKHPMVNYGVGNKIIHAMDEPKIVLPTNTDFGIIFFETCIERRENLLRAC